MFRDPLVVRIGVSLPLDQVLEGAPPSMASLIYNVFYFVLFFSFDKVRRWSFKVGAVGGRLPIGGKEGDVERVPYLPGGGEVEAIGNVG